MYPQYRNKRFRILINNFCNYKCIFCHNEGQFCKSPLILQYAPTVLRKIVNSVENSGITIKDVIFSGGEPTLVKTLFRYIEAFKDKNTIIISNGYTLDYELQKHFLDNGLQEIHFSLHTLNPYIYAYLTKTSCSAFKRVIKNIKDGINLPIKRCINVVLLQNIDHSISTAIQLLQFAKEQHICKIQFIEVFNPFNTSSSDELHSSISYLEKKLIEEGMLIGAKPISDRKTLYKLIDDEIFVVFTKCSFKNAKIKDIDIVIDASGVINFGNLMPYNINQLKLHRFHEN
ncbi:radical SAM protein [Candidatus Parvarchaeota archaeon]|nr:radical SAM protein [Candidatus Parvarchaeota archaeon]